MSHLIGQPSGSMALLFEAVQPLKDVYYPADKSKGQLLQIELISVLRALLAGDCSLCGLDVMNCTRNQLMVPQHRSALMIPNLWQHCYR
jgi:hypothetical protein